MNSSGNMDSKGETTVSPLVKNGCVYWGDCLECPFRDCLFAVTKEEKIRYMMEYCVKILLKNNVTIAVIHAFTKVSKSTIYRIGKRSEGK